MKARSWCKLTALAAFLASAPAGAQDLEGRLTLAIQGGTDSEVTGDILEGASGSLLALPLTVDRKSFRDVYRPKFRGQILLGYGVSASGEVVLKGSYYKVENEGVSAGKAGDAEVFAFLDPYEEWGIEAAYRFYLAYRTRLKSYVAPVGGIRFLERMLVALSVPERGSSITNVPLFKASTVGVVGLDIGFTFDLGEVAYIGLEAGLRYQGKPGPHDALPGFETIDDGGERWSAPVLVSLGVRF